MLSASVFAACVIGYLIVVWDGEAGVPYGIVVIGLPVFLGLGCPIAKRKRAEGRTI